MSFTAMAWASKQKTKTATQKLVLLMLANYADDEDKCWPSKKTLSSACCLSKSAICSNISQLEKAGLIRVEKRDGTSSYIWLNTGVQQEDRGCPAKRQGVSVKRTGGVQQEDTNLSYTQSAKPIIEPDISYDADFAEFWAAYPKRPNNSKAAAKKKYIAARRRNVSHETIMAGVKAYAATRNEAVAKGDNPHFTQMAETWLNKAGWENDYSLPSGVATKLEPATVDDETIDQVIAQYPGVVSNRAEAKRVLAAEIAKGVKVAAIVEAALKYKLYARDMKAVDKPIAPPILETWIRFKWREMDAYVLKRDPLNGKYKIRAANK